MASRGSFIPTEQHCFVPCKARTLFPQLFSLMTMNYFPILKVSNESPEVTATTSGGHQRFTWGGTPFHGSPASLRRSQAAKIKLLE